MHRWTFGQMRCLPSIYCLNYSGVFELESHATGYCRNAKERSIFPKYWTDLTSVCKTYQVFAGLRSMWGGGKSFTGWRQCSSMVTEMPRHQHQELRRVNTRVLSTLALGYRIAAQCCGFDCGNHSFSYILRCVV